jgi:broad specificity phosphatase PhoE
VEKEIYLHAPSEIDPFLSVVSDRELLDCPLSDLGIKQCEETSSTASRLANVTAVFISPLRRALQTAYLLFKTHPNFEAINFIVHPHLRENMHTVCDVPEDWNAVEE